MTDHVDLTGITREYGPPPQYPIESVDNALKLLAVIGQRSAIRLTDATQFLGVASSSAHRMLAMLAFRGFVQQDPATRCYVPGPTLDALAFAALGRHDMRNLARPVLARLNAELRETVHLGQLEGSDVRFIDAVESPQALRVGSRLGRVMPAHCTSTGKALLATLTDEQIQDLYPQEDLVQLTPLSISSRTALLAAVAEIRTARCAVSREESEEGVSSIAVAVPGHRLPPLAINASVPRSRMTAGALKRIHVHIADAVKELADRLM